MGAVYLTDMADWLRAAGLTVVEQDGWKTRSRSAGGFEPGRPWVIMWHHTASRATPERDAAYMSHEAATRPIANLMPARDGTVWVLAAGATNTNGKGSGVRTVSSGTVPVDSMNSYAIGVEIANDGVGEPYPEAQLEAIFTLTLTLCEHLHLDPTDVITHGAYAPDRKFDPARAESVEGGWQPTAATASGLWDLTAIRAELARRASPPPEPEPEPEPPDDEEDDDMTALPALIRSGNGTDEQRKALFWWDGRHIGHVRTRNQANLGIVLGFYRGGTDNEPFENFTADEIQRIIDSSWAGGPTPKGWRPTPAPDTGTI